MADKCYVCPSEKHVDDHHIDCHGGELSPETVPLCRRCHRTYHDLGVDFFEDEYLDKIIEIENRRRQIVYDSLKNTTKPLVLLRREDIVRSDYWYKKHGIKKPKPSFAGRALPAFEFRLPAGEPLCGWDWVHEHLHSLDNWVPRIEVVYPGGQLAEDIDSLGKLKSVIKILHRLKERRV